MEFPILKSRASPQCSCSVQLSLKKFYNLGARLKRVTDTHLFVLNYIVVRLVGCMLILTSVCVSFQLYPRLSMRHGPTLSSHRLYRN